MEQNHQRLQEGAGGADGAEVKCLMELPFCLQRHIHALPPPAVEDTKVQWPFLFTQRYIYADLEVLTNIDGLHSLELTVEECGRAITEYFRVKPTDKEVQDVLSNGDDNEMALRVQLLTVHFGEKPTGLVLLADVSS